MKTLRLTKAELRKIVTTRLLWGFLAAAAVIAAFVFAAVLIGTDAEGAEGFIDTADNQRSLLAFGTNALLLGGLFGALAAAREYSHGTVVPMFLVAPHRMQAMAAQLAAVFVGGAVVGVVGGAITIAAGAVALQLVDYELLISVATMARLIGAAAFASGVGGVIGVGVGSLVRNAGGAVTVIVVLLLVAPPIVAQLVAEAAPWVPTTLIGVVSGVNDEPGLWAAIAAQVAWGVVPAAAGLAAVRTRDVI